MAITKIPALGAAIREKVGVTEEKSVPQLTDIVKEQLITRPTESQTITENGTYDVAEVGEVVVETDERTEEDKRRERDESNWTKLYAYGTDSLNIGASVKEFIGDLPFIDASPYNSLTNTFLNAKMSSINIKISSLMRSLSGAFQLMKNMESIKIQGPTAQVTDWSYAFSESDLLKEIDGELDFSGAQKLSQAFNACHVLSKVNIKPYCININNNFGVYRYIGDHNLCLAIINGLNIVTDAQTTTWSGTLKQKMGVGTTAVWWCKPIDPTAERPIYVKCEQTDEDAISFAAAINSKGWTIV